MVGGLELGDPKVDVLGTVVVPSVEGDRQGDPAERSRPSSRDDAVESLVGRHQGSVGAP